MCKLEKNQTSAPCLANTMNVRSGGRAPLLAVFASSSLAYGRTKRSDNLPGLSNILPSLSGPSLIICCKYKQDVYRCMYSVKQV